MGAVLATGRAATHYRLSELGGREIRVLLWDSKLTKAVLLAITAGIGFLMGFFAHLVACARLVAA
ncbi:MAG: hypothetical protein R3C56_02975 [Pirellulaceae bacterium]